MSILQKPLSIFTRRKPEEIPATTVEPVDQSASSTPPPSDNVIYIYSHGFTNGVYRISPDEDSFETFLEYCNHLDRIKVQRALKEKAVVEAELKLNSEVAAHAGDTNMVIEKEKMAENISLSIAALEQQRLKKDQKETVLVTQAKETHSEYAWAPAFLYFAVGITFIIADISITKQITSWGFSMTGWQSWVFAVGLAFTAFLIKPAIDRLLEKPFQAAGFKLQKTYKYALLGIAIVGLTMLYCLGKFRSDSEIARNKTTDIISQMSLLDPHSQKYIDLQKQYEDIQTSLDENTMGQNGLILSGMLFAIGGAICLSIAFGSLKQLISRYWIIPIRVGRVKREIDGLDKQITTQRSEHMMQKVAQEQAEKRLSNANISLMKDELKRLREERSTLLDEFYQTQYEKERSLYLDGKHKGGKYSIEGDLLYKVSGNDHSTLYLGKQEPKNEGQLPGSVRPYTRRPFVKMRKMIAANFNKNQNNQTYDGSEFEIVS